MLDCLTRYPARRELGRGHLECHRPVQSDGSSAFKQRKRIRSGFARGRARGQPIGGHYSRAYRGGDAGGLVGILSQCFALARRVCCTLRASSAQDRRRRGNFSRGRATAASATHPAPRPRAQMVAPGRRHCGGAFGPVVSVELSRFSSSASRRCPCWGDAVGGALAARRLGRFRWRLGDRRGFAQGHGDELDQLRAHPVLRQRERRGYRTSGLGAGGQRRRDDSSQAAHFGVLDWHAARIERFARSVRAIASRRGDRVEIQ